MTVRKITLEDITFTFDYENRIFTETSVKKGYSIIRIPKGKGMRVISSDLLPHGHSENLMDHLTITDYDENGKEIKDNG